MHCLWCYMLTLLFPLWCYMLTLLFPLWCYMLTLLFPLWCYMLTLLFPLWCYMLTLLSPLLQASGSGSQTAGEDALVDHSDVLEKIEKVENRVITVRFNSDTASSMQWNFRPQQTQVKVSQCDNLSWIVHSHVLCFCIVLISLGQVSWYICIICLCLPSLCYTHKVGCNHCWLLLWRLVTRDRKCVSLALGGST